MFEIFLATLLAAHLLLVDVAMAGPLACVWLEWRETRRADAAAGHLGRKLATIVNGALAGGIAIGGLLLALRWFAGDRDYFSALATIPTGRLWFALAELIFFIACMAAYRALWHRLAHRRIVHRLLAVAAALNLLVHFPALFVIVSVVSTRPQLWGHALDRAGYWRLLLDGEVLSRVAHVWLASLAVTGVALMVLALRSKIADEHEMDRRRLVARFAWLALVPTLLQIPAGVWLALEMPEAAREPILGGELLASGLFALSLLLAVQLMHTLAAIALGDGEPRQVKRSVALMLTLVVLMVAARSRVDHRPLARITAQPPLAAAPR